MQSLKKLYIALTILVAIIVIIVAIIGNYYIEQGHGKFLTFNTERTKVLAVLQQIESNINDSHSALEDIILIPDEQAYLDNFYSSISQSNITISALLELDWGTVKIIQRDLASLLITVNHIEEIILFEFSEKFNGDSDALQKRTATVADTMLKQIEIIKTTVRDLSNQDINQLTSTKDTLVRSIIVIACIGLMIILGIFSMTNFFVLNPLSNLTSALNREADGEETEDLNLPKHIEMRNLIEAFTNMRDQVKLRQAQLEHQAMHDALTGLPNRILLIDRINQLIKDSKRNNIKPGVILIDLDRFKEINDTLGHHVGDTLLQEISRRLIKVLRDLDTIARLGGDEFAIVLHDVSAEGSKVVANKITAALVAPIHIEKHQLLVRCSQGIALYPEHGETDADLLKNADIAMYIAKRSHLGYSMYDPGEDNKDVANISLSADLTNAIKSHQFKLYYQPKIDAKTGTVVSSEALIRWQHPTKGFIPPELIIELAEQSGLILSLTDWVLKTSIEQAVEWRNQGMELSVAVNLSVFNLRNPNFVNTVRELLNESQLDPKLLILEVTESAMMLNPELASKILTELSDMGLQISIDDFGTGYSSLAYLKNLPVHELKIDKSFVMNIVNDKSDISIVKSTIDLAHNLGLKVVAEGVENQESWRILNTLDCDTLQGYFFSKPLAQSEFTNWYVEFTKKPKLRLVESGSSTNK